MQPTLEQAELAAWLRLSLTPGVGHITARKLLQRFGAPAAIFAQSPSTLQTCVTALQSQALQTVPPALGPQLERTWQWLQASTPTQCQLVLPWGHPLYPAALLDSDDPPPLLYLMGPGHLLPPQAPALTARHCVAIVGSRNPTAQGEENALAFARTLRASGLCIVSGLALGIDAAAHEGALQAARSDDGIAATIAVVGTGLDRVYPARHRDLAHRIAAQGWLLSEYPLGTAPLATNFPRRNRLIAGLCQGLLVVEATPGSGSLITAQLAADQGREVFAIPGSIHAPQSRGCHALIRQGAKLVESAQDVLEDLHLPPAAPEPATTSTISSAETNAPAPPESALLRALGFDPVGLDALVARTGFDTASLLVQLLELELEGHVARLPGGLFQRMAVA
ncbi:MAG: DNA-processing protein DprA [Giesbergeria sp.]|uniref:DNA-processing protein DprA n=1 Tax=Giesbergeria sp. TaxID=2818473 RepID=UPI0026166494|nr:DNA-processing protein DprA [Giesbergeria sp.]MDD2609723.1 DNA-processing protein DprA [Giesbergeria sp.]